MRRKMCSAKGYCRREIDSGECPIEYKIWKQQNEQYIIKGRDEPDDYLLSFDRFFQNLQSLVEGI